MNVEVAARPLQDVRERRRRVNRAQLQSLRIQLSVTILLVDCLAIFLGCIIGNAIRFHDLLAPAGLNLCAPVLPLFIGIAINSDAYGSDVLSDVQTGISRALLSFTFTVFAVFFFAFYMKVNADMSRATSTVALASCFFTLVAGRYLCYFYIKLRTGMQLIYDLLILDGVEVPAPPSMHVIDTERDNLRPDTADPRMLNRLAKALRGVDRVVIACPPERRYIWSILLKGSSVNGYILTEELDRLGPIGIGSMGAKHTLAVACAPLDLGRRTAKRTFDLALSVPAIIFLAPLLLIVALAIKLDSRGPVFFMQPRVGRGNRLFLVYKFRSMKTDLIDKSGNKSVTKGDTRVTRVGRFIRSTSIDELPQLFNILRGDMSLVGPRPHALGSTAGKELFWEVDERYWLRHALKPGLTGLAQVRGYRGETARREDLANRLTADLEYLAGWTIWRDIQILFSTLKVIIHKNAY
jgi:exopolysaccharide biosynthesis polyprenyl glycosylphosphotransferase